MQKDHFFLGFLLGIIIPMIGIFFFYLFKFLPDNLSFTDFLFLVKSNQYMIPKIISLGLLATIPLITYYKNRKLYTTLKGIFVAIMLYGIIAVLYKFNML